MHWVRTANLACASSLFGVWNLDRGRYNFVCVDRNLDRVRYLFVCVNRNLNRVRYLFLGCYRHIYVVGLNDIYVVWNLNGVANCFVDSGRNLNGVVLYFCNRLANGYLVGLLFHYGRWNLNGEVLNNVVVNGFVDSVRNLFSNCVGNVDLVRFFDLARNRIVHGDRDLFGFLLWNHDRGCAGLGFGAWHLTAYCVSPSASFCATSGLVDRSHFGNLRWDHNGLFNVADLSATTTHVSATTNHHTANNTSGTGCTSATAIRKYATGPKQNCGQPKGKTWAKLHCSLLEVIKNVATRPANTLTSSTTNKMGRCNSTLFIKVENGCLGVSRYPLTRNNSFVPKSSLLCPRV